MSYLTTPGKCDTLPKGGNTLVLDQGSECSAQSKARHLHPRFHSLNGMREIDSKDTCCSSQCNGLCKVRCLEIRRCHGFQMPTKVEKGVYIHVKRFVQRQNNTSTKRRRIFLLAGGGRCTRKRSFVSTKLKNISAYIVHHSD
jgi:hypothetical protein